MRNRGLLGSVLVSSLLLGLLVVGLTVRQPSVRAQEDSGAVFTIHVTTLESHYPRGMTFTIDAESSAGDITRATLFYELRTGLRERENAELDMDNGLWVARPYSVRGGLPPWVDFHYYWVLTDSAGNVYETVPQYGIYEDNTREWWVVDTDDITLYWFGEIPDLGDTVADAMAEMRENFARGWGRNLSYKPLAILFPPGDIWDEYVEGGNNPNAAGFTSPSEGYTVQRIPGTRNPARHEELRDLCGGYWYGDRENTVEEWRLQDMVHTIVHETTHLHQADFRVGGPFYWTEGQADFFASLTGWHNRYADGRMAAYGANGYDLPTLQGSGPGGGSTEGPDGCHALGYAVGETFVRFIVNNYGGLETHAAIVEAMPGKGMEGAIEEVLGIPFVELENQYRASLGIPPVQLLPTATPFVFPTAPPMVIPTSPPSSGG